MGSMQTLKPIIQDLLLLLILSLLVASACTVVETPPVIEALPSPTEPLVTATPEEPTPIPEPAAALINGEPLPLVWFEREVERYLIAQVSLGNEDIDRTAARETVLRDLIDQVLLAQGAREAGAFFSDADVQARIDDLAREVDLDAWMAAWGFSFDELKETMGLQLLVAFQRDAIAATIPETIEQVELRQIFRFTQAGADRAMLELNSGAAFEALAFESNPETGGYLGWVPRGYLLNQAIEDAAFSLDVGTYSEVIESDVGYHIILVLAKDNRPLSTDARLVLERQALINWLENQRQKSIIEVLVD